ncbi:MAG: LppX_LprAFG lipoprotein [Nocardioides sp.]
MTLSRRFAAGAAAALLALPLAACGNGDASSDQTEMTPAQVMSRAKNFLDETSGVELSLSTQDERSDGDFLKSAEGVITDAPAFQGVAGGRFLGFNAEDVEVRSVDGDFYINAPIVGWDVYDPAQLCAPDPATLLDPDLGVANLLVAATDLAVSEPRRAADDNSVVVTPYAATVPGSAVKSLLPCAPGESFDAVLAIDEDGRLRSADLTGEFFSGGSEVTYTIAITAYGVAQEITAPE